jgi:hypothetical protein
MSARFVKRAPTPPNEMDRLVSVVLDVHVEPGDRTATITGPGRYPLLATLQDRSVAGRAVQSRGTSIVMMDAAEHGKSDQLASERW